MATKPKNDKQLDREIDERDFDSRDTQIRAQIMMGASDPLHIEKEDIAEGMEYFWVRDSCLERPDPHRLVQMKKIGWSPVPVSQHPNMVPEFDSNRRHHLDGYVHYNGLLLCQRPKRYGEIQRQIENEANMAAMYNVPGRDGMMGEDPRMPTKVYGNQTNITQGTRFQND